MRVPIWAAVADYDRRRGHKSIAAATLFLHNAPKRRYPFPAERYFDMNTVAVEKPENRRAPRFALEQVVAVKSLDGLFEDTSGVSRDVSACGLFFYVDKCLPVGATVELFMMMPIEGALVHDVFPLRAYGAVVRSAQEVSRCGVGVAFDKVEVIAGN